MKKFSAVILVLLLMIMGACNNSQKSNESKGDDSENDSILFQKTYHSGGGLWKVNRAKKVIVDGKVKYVIDGENLVYYKTPQNALSSKAFYKDGKRSGLYQKFYTDGKLYFDVNYENGKMDGIKRSYMEDGSLRAETPYKKGSLGTGTVEYTSSGVKLPPMEMKVWYKRNGSSVTVYAKVLNKGKLTKRVEFFNGPLIEGKYYHKNLQKVTVKDGIAKITLVDPSYVVISAKAKSAYNNYSFLTQTLNIK
jgi:antitoxin component YwqK of YwqJK toxin-antitoxin module